MSFTPPQLHVFDQRSRADSQKVNENFAVLKQAISGSYSELNDAIENNSTDLSYALTATSVRIDSSTGENVELPLATALTAGLLTSTQFNQLAGLTESLNARVSKADIATSTDVSSSTANKWVDAALLKSELLSIPGADTSFNLSYIKSPTGGTINNPNGNNANITLVDDTDAGLMAPAQHLKLEGIEVNATADQTGVEIASLYEAQADRNAYTDAEKAKVGNVPANTNSALTGKVNTVDKATQGDLDASTIDKWVDATLLKAQNYLTSILDNSISTVKLQNLSVTTAKLADANVTLAKMATDSVGTSQIVNSAVTAAKIASGAVGSTQIANGAVSNSRLVSMASNTIKARVSGSSGSPEDATPAQIRAMLNVAEGATANASDAQLRDRATHTGAQAISTITGLQTALDARLRSVVAGEPAGADTVANVVSLTQAEYNAGTPNATAFYIITDAT